MKILGLCASMLQKYKICFSLMPPSFISVTMRLINLNFLGNPTFWCSFHIIKKIFFEKSTLSLSFRYATFARLRFHNSEAEIWCRFYNFWWAICKSLETQVFVMSQNISLGLISLQNQLWMASIFQKIMFINKFKNGRK